MSEGQFRITGLSQLSRLWFFRFNQVYFFIAIAEASGRQALKNWAFISYMPKQFATFTINKVYHMSALATTYLDTVLKRFRYYKSLGDKTFEQLTDKDFHTTPGESSNSLAIIIQHMSGNMLSRWTNFLTEDGEKAWRSRDAEFEVRNYSKEELLALWEKGWDCLLNALSLLTADDLLATIYIRREPLIVIDAINRQLAHYPYHVGQLVYIGKMIRQQDWKSLSIEKGQSDTYNQSEGIKDPAKLF